MHFAYNCNNFALLFPRSFAIKFSSRPMHSSQLFLRRGKLWKVAELALSAWSTSKSQPSPDQTVICLIRCDIYIFLKVNMIRGVSKDLPALLKHVKQQVSGWRKWWQRRKLMHNTLFRRICKLRKIMQRKQRHLKLCEWVLYLKSNAMVWVTGFIVWENSIGNFRETYAHFGRARCICW